MNEDEQIKLLQILIRDLKESVRHEMNIVNKRIDSLEELNKCKKE